MATRASVAAKSARKPATKRTSATDDATPLARYNAKRDFTITAEPAGRPAKSAKQLSFVIQKHWATRLHYDFRLELDGVLLSWAVPKGPSFDPKVKRMAIHVEDHPVSYGSFEGRIPEKQYGAGTVIVWDAGTWEPIGDPRQGIKDGKLVFALHGQKLAGKWELVKIAKPGERQEPWLLFKKHDEWEQPNDAYDVVAALPDSIVEKPLGLLEKRDPRGAATTAPVVADPTGLGTKRALPKTLSPQLATLAKSPPSGDGWSVEAKFDGYRIVTRIEKGRARLFTRNGHDWTDKLASLAAAIEALGIDNAWLDGEIVVLKSNGSQDFNALQNAMDNARSDSVTYFVFDAPFFEGRDLRAERLDARRALLRAFFAEHGHERVRFSDDFTGDVTAVFDAARKIGLEGVMVKRRDARYVEGRTDTWLKLKGTQRQEFVIGGYTDRKGSTKEVGGLLLGVHDPDGKLRYAGMVGTGWTPSVATDLKSRLMKLGVERSPFETGSTKESRWSRRTPGEEHWVEPTTIAEVAFAEWTPDGHVRHASFKGLRSDKPPTRITREVAVDPPPVPAKKKKEGAAMATPMKITHPERVIDATSGATKLDLVRYYESVADLILPHLKGRPVSLVRGPSGVGGELFFQKHLETKMPGVTVLDASLWPKHAALIQIDTKEALLSAAQMNTIEFHTWNARSKAIDKPDRMIFDLDPGEGTPWRQVQEAASLTHALLEELGLVAFLKTSGGKGLHVVVPITPRADWDTVKSFSQQVVQHLAKTIPDRFVAKSGGSNRVGKLFVDYLRNGHGATTAVAFSARARPGLGVSIPIAWDALDSLKSGSQWTIATAREYLSFQKDDPWADYATTKQTITAAAKKLNAAG